MFHEHHYMIWGTTCTCGSDNYILQNQYHPWNQTEFKLKMKCIKCNDNLEIDQIAASDFYNKKIYTHFNDVKGTVMDLGCGGGFLTQFLIEKQDVNKVYAIDVDPSSKNEIKKLIDMGKGVVFNLLDIKDISSSFGRKSIDYIVSRDVFIFVEDPKKYFDDITRIARKGIRQMAWFSKDNKRMKNSLNPFDIVEELKKRKWKVELEILEWYKSGYFVKADK